jgi:predicted phosphoribosyltransferase
VRKLGAPGNEELAMGAIAGGGVRVLNDDVIRAFHVTDRELEAVVEREQAELQRRERLYRGQRSPLDVRGKTVLLVDDGLATGATMRAGVAALRQMGAADIVVAVPTAAPSTCQEFEERVATVICVITPEPFYGVGLWYDDFSQTSDAEVTDLLARAAARAGNG